MKYSRLRDTLDLKTLKKIENIYPKVFCDAHENEKYRKMYEDDEPLPEGIYTNDHSIYYRHADNGMTSDEIIQLILLRKLTELISLTRHTSHMVVTMTLLMFAIFIFAMMVFGWIQYIHGG